MSFVFHPCNHGLNITEPAEPVGVGFCEELVRGTVLREVCIQLVIIFAIRRPVFGHYNYNIALSKLSHEMVIKPSSALRPSIQPIYQSSR
jgi:hypothetical protein